jgi:serine protease Do
MKLGLVVLPLGLLAITGFAQQTPRPGSRNVQVITQGNQPYLGIGVRDIDPDSAKKFNLKEVRGTEVTSVTDDSPAAKAGVKQGDVILEFNGQPIEGGEQLSRLVRETPIGRQIHLGVWRNGSVQTLTATVETHKGVQSFTFNGNGGWPQVISPEEMRQMQEQLPGFRLPDLSMPGMGMPSNTPMLGIMGEPLGQEKQLAEYFGVEDGVLVKSVNRGGAAEKAGIKAGDVILKVDDSHISTTRDITMALRSARSKKTVTVVVIRNHKEMPITVTIDTPTTGGVGSPVRAMVIPGRMLRTLPSAGCTCGPTENILIRGRMLQLLPENRVI